MGIGSQGLKLSASMEEFTRGWIGFVVHQSALGEGTRVKALVAPMCFSLVWKLSLSPSLKSVSFHNAFDSFGFTPPSLQPWLLPSLLVPSHSPPPSIIILLFKSN